MRARRAWSMGTDTTGHGAGGARRPAPSAVALALALAVALLPAAVRVALAQEAPDPGPPDGGGGGGVDLGPILGGLGGLADALEGLEDWLGERWAEFLGVVGWALGMAPRVVAMALLIALRPRGPRPHHRPRPGGRSAALLTTVPEGPLRGGVGADPRAGHEGRRLPAARARRWPCGPSPGTSACRGRTPASCCGTPSWPASWSPPSTAGPCWRCACSTPSRRAWRAATRCCPGRPTPGRWRSRRRCPCRSPRSRRTGTCSGRSGRRPTPSRVWAEAAAARGILARWSGRRPLLGRAGRRGPGACSSSCCSSWPRWRRWPRCSPGAAGLLRGWAAVFLGAVGVQLVVALLLRSGRWASWRACCPRRPARPRVGGAGGGRRPGRRRSSSCGRPRSGGCGCRCRACAGPARRP